MNVATELAAFISLRAYHPYCELVPRHPIHSTGQPANDFNKPKVDLGPSTLALRPAEECAKGLAQSSAGYDGAAATLDKALELVKLTPPAG